MTTDPVLGPRPLWAPDAIPAATVVPLRDGGDGLEVLMLRRDTELTFAGGMWVFPGGRIDDADFPGGSRPAEPDDTSLEAAARSAALREATEESAIVLEPSTVRRWTQWTPPEATSRAAPAHRFTTAFYVGVAVGDTDAVVVDDGEIRDHRWTAPTTMIERHAAGEVMLAPPTYITLCQLAAHRNPAEVLLAVPRAPEETEHFSTRVSAVDEEIVLLYHGDVAYDAGEPDAAGPRHRLHMGSPFRYERDTDDQGVGRRAGGRHRGPQGADTRPRARGRQDRERGR